MLPYIAYMDPMGNTHDIPQGRGSFQKEIQCHVQLMVHLLMGFEPCTKNHAGPPENHQKLLKTIKHH